MKSSFLKKHRTIANLPNNSRFYILCASVLLSICIFSLLRVHIASTQLFYIRLEQFYGLFSLIFLYIALITTPLSKILPKDSWITYMLFARRALGVSSAYFALLHAVVAIWGQSGGLQSLGLFPNKFKVAFVLGATALVILLLMAATSFDKAITRLTFPRWKRLHQCVYIAGVFIILHVWLIGTHMGYTWIKIIGSLALGIFFALEAYRIQKNDPPKTKIKNKKVERILATFVLWLFFMAMLFTILILAGNYHNERHTDQVRIDTYNV